MRNSRTSGGDPARSLALLWRHEAPARSRPGPSPRLRVDDVVDAAIARADHSGLEGLTIREVAGKLDVSAMTVYTYVPSKAELLDLMVDALYARMPRRPWSPGQRWRTRVRLVAEANRALYEAHPWLAEVSTARPPLGPGLMAKYDHELAALDGVGLSDVEMDATLTLVLGFVHQLAVAARDVADVQAASGTETEWWAAVGPELARYADPERYPLAARMGTSAGEAQGGSYDAGRAYEFGLERLLDGLGALIQRGRGEDRQQIGRT